MSRVVAYSANFDLVRIVIGGLLLIAAALKSYQLSLQVLVDSHEFSLQLSAILLIDYELMLAAWLFSGRQQRPAWMFSLATFGVFGVAALLKALFGFNSGVTDVPHGQQARCSGR